MTRELRDFGRGLDITEGVIAGVADWSAASPCAGWTAGEVAGHLTGGQHMVRALAAGTPPPDTVTRPGLFLGADPLASWREARKECAEALTPAALASLVPMGALGELPLADFLGGYVLELLVHSWDLAAASGQDVHLDADLVHHAFATAQVIAGPLRAAGHLAAPLRPPAGAGELTRLLAFLGRAA